MRRRRALGPDRADCPDFAAPPYPHQGPDFAMKTWAGRPKLPFVRASAARRSHAMAGIRATKAALPCFRGAPDPSDGNE